MFEIIESLLFNIQYKLYLYEEINSMIKQFIIVLSIKDVILCYVIHTCIVYNNDWRTYFLRLQVYIGKHY